MLQKLHERYRELLCVGLIVVTLGSMSLYALLVEGKHLERLAVEREVEIERLRNIDVMYSSEIGALQAEIDHLKTDSEETSLVARTLLGMVAKDEVIYQLNNQEIEEEP